MVRYFANGEDKFPHLASIIIQPRSGVVSNVFFHVHSIKAIWNSGDKGTKVLTRGQV